MKDMIKRIREEREGFTLAELLIVVAIIAVLVAIAIPVFNSQLEKSRDAADAANVRAAYAEATAAYISDESATKTAYYAYNVKIQGTDDKWSQDGTVDGSFKIANMTVDANKDGQSVWFQMGENGCTAIKISKTTVTTEGAQASATALPTD